VSNVRASEALQNEILVFGSKKTIERTLRVDWLFYRIVFLFVVVQVKYQLHFEFHNHFDDPNEEATIKFNTLKLKQFN
jgi:hypothetical protein